MVSSSKKKRGKQRKATKQQTSSAVASSSTPQASYNNNLNQLVVYTPSGGIYIHPEHHDLFSQYARRGDNNVSNVLTKLTSEDVPTNGICWPNISLSQSGIVSSVLTFLSRCEDETFDKVMAEAKGNVLLPNGALISNVGGDLVAPCTWIDILSKAVELVPDSELELKIAENIGPLVRCMCSDTERLFFQSNKHWSKSIRSFVQLISVMILSSTYWETIDTLVEYEGLLSSIVQWQYWKEHRPDITSFSVMVLKRDGLEFMDGLSELITCGDMLAEAAIRKLVTIAAINPSAEDRQLLGRIGSIPIVSKDYDSDCMISFTARLIHFMKDEKSKDRDSVLTILRPLMKIGDCIDKDVIMGIIDLGMNHVHDYDSAVVVVELSAVMLRKGTVIKSCDTRIAFAIRCGLIEMCLNLIGCFGTHVSCEEDTKRECECCQCPNSLNSLYNHVASIFDNINDVVLHQKTAKAIRSKRGSIEEKLVSLEGDERISSNPTCIDMIRSILETNGSYCCRCNRALSKTDVKQCNGCGRMAYCSRACQRKDWFNGHSLTCGKPFTIETAGQFQGRCEPTAIPNDERAEAKLEELEKNITMVQLKVFLDNSETILDQAEALDTPLCDCVVKFNLRSCPPTVEVEGLNDSNYFDSDDERKGFEGSKSKDNVTCVYSSNIFYGYGKLDDNTSTYSSLRMQRLFPLEWLNKGEGSRVR